MTSDWRGRGALHDPRPMSQPYLSDLNTDGRNGETRATSAARGARSRPEEAAFAVPSAPGHVALKNRRQDDQGMDIDPDATATQRQQQDRQSQRHLRQMTQDGGASSSQSLNYGSVTNSQESTVTASTDQVATPPASDTSGGLDTSAVGVGPGADGRWSGKPARARPLASGEDHAGAASQSSQLLHLSAIAAAQDRLASGAMGGGSRKRMADGETKERGGSMSPVKGHSRTTSAISMASTAGSHIGEVSLC